MTVYEYAKLSKTRKQDLLSEEGVFMEVYEDGQETIHVYLLNGFFVEVTAHKGRTIYNLPYERGYKITSRSIQELVKRNVQMMMVA